MSLEERLSEVETAVSRGRWHAAHEAALLVTQTEDELARVGGPPPAVADRIADHLASLTGLLAAAPAGRSDAAQDISAARAAIRAANDHAAAAAAGRGHGGGGAGTTGGTGGTGNGGGNGNGGNGKGNGGGTSSAPAPSVAKAHLAGQWPEGVARGGQPGAASDASRIPCTAGLARLLIGSVIRGQQRTG